MNTPETKKLGRGKGLLIGLIVLLLLLGAAAGFGYGMFKDILGAANSYQKLDDGLYYAEFKGNTGLAEMLEQGGVSSEAEVAAYASRFLSGGFYVMDTDPTAADKDACSTLSVCKSDGSALFGRNFDWEDCAGLILRIEPDDGYASVTTCNLDFLGFDEGFVPEEMSDKIFALAALFVPLDGMNEKGLCVADLQLPEEPTAEQNTDKPDLTTTTAIRLLLDKAATVDEALALLEQYDMHPSAGMGHHLSIADADGKHVVVEYYDGEMHVLNTAVVTNFYLTEGRLTGEGSEQSKQRYAALELLNAAVTAAWDETSLTKAMQVVWQGNYGDFETTQWSVIYDQENGKLTYYHREDADMPYVYNLK